MRRAGFLASNTRSARAGTGCSLLHGCGEGNPMGLSIQTFRLLVASVQCLKKSQMIFVKHE